MKQPSYFKILSDLNETFDGTQQEIGVNVSLVNFIKNKNIVSAQTGIPRYLSQQKSLRQKKNPSFVRFVFLESDLIPNLVPVLVEGLEPDSIGKCNASDTTRLGASDIFITGLQKVLRHLETNIP